MKLQYRTHWLALVLSAFTLSPDVSPAFAQGTAFTYQGILNLAGTNYSGSAEFQPTLWDAATSGNQIAANVSASVIVAVTNGLFVLPLDFGGSFPGASRWLQLNVRTTLGTFTTLTPRQAVMPTPYAITAGGVVSSGLTGTYPNAVTLNNPANQFGGMFTGNGANVTNVNAATLGGVSSAGFWKTSGNAGANPTNGAFLGTTDNLPLEFRVNNTRAWRLQYGFDSLWSAAAPSVIAGSEFNYVGANVLGGVVAGGGTKFNPNAALGDYSSVVGGFASVAGGRYSIAGGRISQAMGQSALAFGSGNVAQGDNSVALGSNTRATNLSAFAIGENSVAGGNYSVALGRDNVASGESSAAIGWGNTTAALGAVALGVASAATGERSFAAGFLATAGGFCSTALGRTTSANGAYSFAAGLSARANQDGTFVWADSSGGDFISTGMYQFLVRALGGVGINTASPKADLHLYSNNNPATFRIQSIGTPGFGRIEFVSNPQGDVNEWRPAFIQSLDAGNFTGGIGFYLNGVGSGNKFATNEVMRIQNGRVGIGTTAPTATLSVNGTANNTTGAWGVFSDARLKENIAPMTAGSLDQLLRLRGVTYDYNRPELRQGYTGTHRGWLAQEVERVFPDWVSETAEGLKMVTPVGFNALTVEALRELRAEKDAALRDLQEELEARSRRLEKENQELKAQNESLAARLERLERLLVKRS